MLTFIARVTMWNFTEIREFCFYWLFQYLNLRIIFLMLVSVKHRQLFRENKLKEMEIFTDFIKFVMGIVTYKLYFCTFFFFF